MPAVAMELTGLELEFLKRLRKEPWLSPPLFDHSLVVRLVEVGYVRSEALLVREPMVRLLQSWRETNDQSGSED